MSRLVNQFRGGTIRSLSVHRSDSIAWFRGQLQSRSERRPSDLGDANTPDERPASSRIGAGRSGRSERKSRWSGTRAVLRPLRRTNHATSRTVEWQMADWQPRSSSPGRPMQGRKRRRASVWTAAIHRRFVFARERCLAWTECPESSKAPVNRRSPDAPRGPGRDSRRRASVGRFTLRASTEPHRRHRPGPQRGATDAPSPGAWPVAP